MADKPLIPICQGSGYAPLAMAIYKYLDRRNGISVDMEAKSQPQKPKPSGVTTIGEVLALTLPGKNLSAEKRKQLIEAAEKSESAVGLLSRLLRQT
jgi:hypothetical protein